MRVIRIPLNTRVGDTLFHNTEIDQWCQENGLVKNKDYQCAYMTARKEFHVTFNLGYETYASMLAMRFM